MGRGTVFYARPDTLGAVTGGSELLGNFPQAFSHIGLITAVAEIDKARSPGNQVRSRR